MIDVKKKLDQLAMTELRLSLSARWDVICRLPNGYDKTLARQRFTYLCMELSMDQDAYVKDVIDTNTPEGRYRVEEPTCVTCNKLISQCICGCHHERLTEDGICRRCGVDCRRG